MSSVGLGIVLGLAGSIAINTGNNLQSLGMYELELSQAEEQIHSKEEKKDLKVCSSKTWVFGTVIFVTGALLNFASYGFAPQSTLASLESVQFVTNLFLGKLLLKKEVTKRMYLGTFLTVGGTLVTVTFSSKEAEMVEVMGDLVELWENALWIGYILFIVLLAILLHISFQMYKDVVDAQNAMAVVYAVFSALWGTLSVVFAKLLAQLVEFQANNVNIFSHWFTYVTILAWLVLMMYWLYRLNTALGLYNPLFIIPLLQANFIFFAIVSGGIYFKEFNYMDSVQWIGFTSGIICMFSGIALLVPPKVEQLQPEAEETAAYKASSLKNFLTMFMTGAGRMNQQEFDLKTRTDIYVLWLEEYEKKKFLTRSETRLTDLLRNYVDGASKTLAGENELRDILGAKCLKQKDSARVKSIMKRVKSFQFKLGEADREISRQSARVRHKDKPSIFPITNRLWSFRIKPSLSKNEQVPASESDNVWDDSVSDLKKKGRDGRETPSQANDNSIKIHVADISSSEGISDVERKRNKRFLGLSDDMVFGDDGTS